MIDCLLVPLNNMPKSAIQRFQIMLAQAGARAAMLCCLLAAGCAVTPEAAYAPQAVRPAACEGDVELGGRFSVRYTQDGREEALHGGFAWRQIGKRTDVALLSPVGQTMATIEVTPKGAALTEAGKLPRRALDVDALAAAELGWPLPVAGLKEWLRGCALDASGRRFIASPRHDSVTTHNGWRIRYVSWQESAAGLLPRRIDLERGEVSLRLVVDQPSP